MNKSFKRFISTMLVACMAMSMTAGAQAKIDIDTTKDFVQETVDGTLHYFDREEWRYSVSLLNDGRALFCAIDKGNEGVVYQKFFDRANDIVLNTVAEGGAVSNAESIAKFGFAHLSEAEVIGITTVDEAANIDIRLEDPIAVRLKGELQSTYGTDYNNNLKYTSNYSGKSFDVMETQMTGATKLGSKYFDAAVTVGAIVTAFATQSITVLVISRVLAVAAGASTVVGFASSIDRYGCSTVRTRDTYTAGVSYLINSTWMEYGYIGLNNGAVGNTQPPQLAYDTTAYQHSQSYFNDYAQQVRDAHRNHFG